MKLRKIISAALAAALLSGSCASAADAPEISAPSAILIEKSTGAVIYEKNADERLAPASVTKIMTMLLTVEAIEAGRLSPDEIVTASAYASSMGGSQIYLAEGERRSAGDMLKSVAVASANDAAAALAEHLAGSETAFVGMMNERATSLGMNDTVFSNCTGLPCESEHLTTARDISKMARELISHDMIKEYTTLWTDTVRNGEFGLSNTNKLIRFYDGATGLKTGFTSEAGYCLAATAERDGTEYIAVVLHCDTSDGRFESAKALLSYAFSNYTLYEPSVKGVLPPVRVTLGKSDYVQPVLGADTPLLLEKTVCAEASAEYELADGVSAPVRAGDALGKLTVTAGGGILGEYPIVADTDVPRLSRTEIFLLMLGKVMLGRDIKNFGE